MKFSAALFAGGRSSRMGRDKAFIEIDGLALWQRQLETLRALGASEIFLSGLPDPNCRAFLRNAPPLPASDTDALPQYCAVNDIEPVADVAVDCGPLGGLVGVLRRCEETHLLALAVDLPNMTSAFLTELLSSCRGAVGVVPKRNDRYEPLAAIYPVVCLPLAENCLNSGEYSLQQLISHAVKAALVVEREVTDAEESLFLNLNTPADFSAIGKK